MKLTLSLTLTALTTAAFAQEGQEIVKEKGGHQHCFSPKYSYRYHNEEGYKYKTHAGGFEYNLSRPEGINLMVSLITNGKNKNVLVESEQSLFYKKILNSENTLMPSITFKNSSHQIGKDESHDYFISKLTGFVGIGWERQMNDDLSLSLEGEVFRDLNNSLIAQEKDNFWGKSFSNPFGFRAKLCGNYQLSEKKFLSMEGYYARTFSKCYEELSIETAFKWGF